MTLTVKSFANARDAKPDVLDREDRSTVLAVVVEYLRLWAQESFIDGEYLAEAGNWVAQSHHVDMDVAAAALLRSESTPAMQNAVSAFLDGYWGRRPVSDAFDLTTYAVALDTFPPQDKAYAATALALYSALCSPASCLNDAQQSFIRHQLLIARGKLLARNLFPHVLGSLDYLVAPGQSRPIVDVGSYQAYRCDDGPSAYLVVERLADAVDVLHVHHIAPSARSLEVSYEILDRRHADVDAPPLIAALILSELLEDRFRGRVDTIEYTNIRTQLKQSRPYLLGAELTS